MVKAFDTCIACDRLFIALAQVCVFLQYFELAFEVFTVPAPDFRFLFQPAFKIATPENFLNKPFRSL